MTTVAILPIKSFHTAKSRLAGAIEDGFRQSLVEAMFSDVMRAVRHAPSIDRIVVVTSDGTASRIAAGHGAGVIDDTGASHSESAAQGIAAAISQGAQRVMLIAGDCPMLTADELERLLAHRVGDERSALIVPDRHGTGTNGLVLSPPDALTPSFGDGSCERHFELALAQGSTPEVVPVAGLGMDVDTAEDLEALRAMMASVRGGAGHTRGIFAQLERNRR